MKIGFYKNKSVWILSLCLISGAFLLFRSYFGSTPECVAPGVLPRIAHAGGGYRTWNYTNSINALNANSKAFSLLELDFNFTSDHQIVCIHDWNRKFHETFGTKAQGIPSLAEFEHLANANPKYANCTLKTLAEWLRKHPGKRIVTDAKDHNPEILANIAQNYPELKQQFIPEVHHPEEYAKVRSLGFKDIIFAIYLLHDSDDTILQAIKSMHLFALAIPSNHSGTLPVKAACMGVSTYAHTVNSEEEFQRLKRKGVKEIYTDWLKPEVSH